MYNIPLADIGASNITLKDIVIHDATSSDQPVVYVDAVELVPANQNTTPTYTYDANGNMTSDGEKCFQYNEANQMDKVSTCSNNQTIAEYVYDYTGMRMVKRNFTNGTLANTVTSWSDNYETKVIVGGATENTAYYFANGQLIAKKDKDGNKTYVHSDHLGSTSVVTNQSGGLVEATAYDPWGKVKSGGTASKFQYTGQEKDSETGLNYYNARYYDTNIRRFTQPDDLIQNVYNPQDLNRYSYVRNNPLRYTDPSGHNVVVGKNGRISLSWETTPKKQQKKPQTYYEFIQAVSKSSNTQTRSSSSPSSNSGGGNTAKSSGSNSGGGSTTSSASPQTAGTVLGASYASSSNSINTVSKRDTNTHIIGLCGNANAGLALYGTGSICGNYSTGDNKFGWTRTAGGGLTTGITGSIGVNLQYSNVKNYSDILGQDVFTGVSFGEGLELNGDVSWSVDDPNVRSYNGGVGLGTSFSIPVYPGEFHGGSTYTWGSQW